MQSDTDDESNFIQLLKLRGKDQRLLLKWLEREEDKYTSHDIQNEIIAGDESNIIVGSDPVWDSDFSKSTFLLEFYEPTHGCRAMRFQSNPTI